LNHAYNVNGTLVASTQDSDGRFTNLDNNINRIDIRNAPQAAQRTYEIGVYSPQILQ